jgi:NTP pyrophosphatase (non-canonical NTP hydrolase)
MSDELKAMLRQAPMNGFAIRTLAYIEKLEAQLAARCSAVSEQPSFQKRVHGWMMDCFSMEICRDRQERNHRFLEEALELVQACECTASEAHQLVDYVYGRDQGDINQEVGGVMVTLAALCLANDIDMHQGGEIELARILQPAIMNKIRAKQASKPKHSPLPAHPAPGAGAEHGPEASRILRSLSGG